MKIGIDIDDTITNTWEVFLPHYSKAFNIPIDTLKELTPYYPGISDKVTLEEYFEKILPVYKKYTKTVKLKDNVKETIDKLYELGHTVIFITARGARQPKSYEETKYYLDKHKIKYDKLIVNALQKADICVEEKIDLFIDDSINHCKEVSAKGIDVIMFETAYNKKNKEFKHLKDWNEIYEYIKNRG